MLCAQRSTRGFVLRRLKFSTFPTSTGVASRTASSSSKDRLESLVASGILCTVVLSSISGFSYATWKSHELSKLHERAENLATNGFIYLNMEEHVPSSVKSQAYEKYLKPHLLNYWKKVEPQMNLNQGEEEYWPQNELGRVHHLTSRKTDIENMPKVFSGYYTLQAVVAYLVDPRLNLIHFGAQTSWKLKFLISPLWAISHAIQAIIDINIPILEDFCKPKHMFEFQCADQSWHIVVLPNTKYGTLGVPQPYGAHYDNGEAGIYRKGIPPLRTNDVTSYTGIPSQEYSSPANQHTMLSSEHRQRMLAMALHQLSILFYCETPGILNESTGMTGFWPRSHLVMLEGLRTLLSQPNTNTEFVGHEEEPTVIHWGRHSSALKSLYQYLVDHQSLESIKDIGIEAKRKVFVQPTMHDGQAILAMGPIVHSGMWAREFMKPGRNVRSLLNCKIAGSKELRRGKPTDGSDMSSNPVKWSKVDYSMQQQLLDRIPKDSFLYQMYVGPFVIGRSSGIDENYITQNEISHMVSDYVTRYNKTQIGEKAGG